LNRFTESVVEEALRDMLLPKIITGELGVKDVDRSVSEVA
jgi:hypothetical protein